MFHLSLLLASIVTISRAKFSCLPNSNITCIDAKRFYKCTPEDCELARQEDALSTMMFMRNIETYLQSNDLDSCENGYCADVPTGCQPNYNPGSECSCNNNGYACLSLTTYMYCNDDKQVVGTQAIECPKGEVCYFIGPNNKSPCMKVDDMARSLSVHCYNQLPDALDIVIDYTTFCNEHEIGYYLLPDHTDCSRYLVCNETLKPNFRVQHCPHHQGFNLETEQCEKVDAFSCVAKVCDKSYSRILNYNRKDCKR